MCLVGNHIHVCLQVYVRFVVTSILAPLASLPATRRSMRWALLRAGLLLVRLALTAPGAADAAQPPALDLVLLFDLPDGVEKGMLRALPPRAGPMLTHMQCLHICTRLHLFGRL